MALLRMNQASLAYGVTPLLDKVSWQIARGERVCVIGRNGTGKSTMLQVVKGVRLPDEGEVWRAPGLKIGELPQELPQDDERRVYEVVASGLQGVGELLTRYQQLSASVTSEDDLQQLTIVQQELEARDGWRLQQLVESTMSRLQLPAEALMSDLSGGWRRRVLLAQALVAEPDLLLLDEPTNHLDIGAIAWLEEVLLDFQGAVLFITHDRAFLQRLATRILELDRGQLLDWDGDYASFLQHKEQLLAAEETANALFDKKLAQEEVWIRQGIKARRTRNEGRVRALKAMRQERSQRRERQGQVSLHISAAERSGKQVVLAKGVSFAYPGEATMFEDFNIQIMRGDRIGFLGANGSGKTTMLKLLLGKLEPTAGSIEIGTNLQVAYFDQMREQLDLEKSVADNVADGSDSITVDGKSRHVLSYLADFLFSPERARTPVKALSGGERARLLLARLFTRPANLLVLDEPTNDLDMETLDLLEDLLLSFSGTVLLVSHDRTFLDNVVTSTLVFDGSLQVSEFFGGFDDWLRQGGSLKLLGMTEKSGADSQAAEKNDLRQEKPTMPGTKLRGGQNDGIIAPKKKLSYKLQLELDGIPAQIEALEQELGTLQERASAAEFYLQPHEHTEPVLLRMQEIEHLLEQLLERWAELES